MAELNKLSETVKIHEWALLLTNSDFDVFHAPCSSNLAATSLSRYPIGESKHNREWILERRSLKKQRIYQKPSSYVSQ